MCAVTIDGVERILGVQGGGGMSVGWQRVSACVNVCRADVKPSKSGRIIHRGTARRARPRIRPAKPARLLEPFVYRMMQSCPPDPSQAAVSRTAGSPARILVVDDDPGMRSLLEVYLGDSGFAVETAGDGAAMWQLLAHGLPDAIVLDLMLPGESGLTLCKEIRSQSAVPILMISAHGEPIERIISLEVGADDFVSKPFDIRELVARIHSVLRRTQAGRQPAASHGSDKPPRQIQFGDWRLNVGLRQLQDKQGVVIPLSNAEFRLLSVLLQRPRTILDRELLLDLTRGCTVDAFDRSIDILISRLRHKLQDDPRNPRLIRTVRGEGYILDAATSCL